MKKYITMKVFLKDGGSADIYLTEAQYNKLDALAADSAIARQALARRLYSEAIEPAIDEWLDWTGRK